MKRGVVIGIVVLLMVASLVNITRERKQEPRQHSFIKDMLKAVQSMKARATISVTFSTGNLTFLPFVENRTKAEEKRESSSPPTSETTFVKKEVQHTGGTRLTDLDPKRHHWYLGVCASTAFSSEWLQEWIELQLLGGVGHIWLIDDSAPGSDPKTGEIIRHYEELGLVTGYEGGIPASLPGCNSYKNCIAPKLCHAITHQYVDQFIFADTDEFIYPTMGCDVSEHVKQHCDQNRAHHMIRWERFGTSGHYDQPRGLMIENFLASGGDCSAHTARNNNCVKKTWDFCSECKHMKSMYNTKCVGTEHVGHVHIAANTSVYKKNPAHWAPGGGIVQNGSESIWHHEACVELPWKNDVKECRAFSNGAQFPPKLTGDCCTAGIGYNHYGTKWQAKWDLKMKTKSNRGFKPGDFAVVEQNSTIASNVLRFVRAMRERWELLGLEVSTDVRFYDKKETKQSTFIERGWRYVEARDRGTREEVVQGAASEEDCADACWEGDGKPPAPSRCGGWSFNLKEKECRIVHSPFNSWKDGRDLGYLRWPHTAFSADRVKDQDYVSGIPLHEGECPLPERLRKTHSRLRSADERLAVGGLNIT